MQINVRNLTKAYGSSRALDGVSLDVGPGEIVALLGANGAGKTTLLRCLATVAAPTSGSIELDGERLTRSRLDLRRRLFFLPDTPFLHYDATPVRHLAMVARVYGKEASLTADRAWRLLEDLDLLGSAAAPAMNLSRGQAYKTALAGLLAVDPELALVDEPFASGMDPHGMLVFKRWAREAAGRGTALLYSTQILEIAEGFADRVAVFHQGRLHLAATLAELRERGAADETGVLPRLLEELRTTP